VKHTETSAVLPEARAIPPVFSAVFENKRVRKGIVIDRIDVSFIRIAQGGCSVYLHLSLLDAATNPTVLLAFRG
jgi:hypothetical protein